MTDMTEKIIEIIQSIPNGSVMSYGEVAASAGLPNGARQVAWVLHSLGEKKDLPWHRVLKAGGVIAFASGPAFELQKTLLEAEGHTIIDGKCIERK